MKSLLLTVAFSVLCVAATQAQYFLRGYVEQTKISPKHGLAAGWELNRSFELGMFVQEESSMLESNSEKQKPRFYEEQFLGVFFGATLYYDRKFDVKLNVRTGAVNKTGFAITPSVLASYALMRNIAFEAGIGTRAFRPTLQAGIRIRR